MVFEVKVTGETVKVISSIGEGKLAEFLEIGKGED